MTLSLDRSDWQKVKFGDVVRNVNDNVRDPASAGIKRVLGLEHLEPGELHIQRWSDVSPESTFTRRVRPGQTLFGKRRAYQRKTAYAEFDAVCSGDILVFESADPTRLLPELLPFIAMTDAFYAMALETSAGSLSPRTRWSDIAKYEFALPPLDQQRRMTDLMWAVEREAGAVRTTGRAAEKVESALLRSLWSREFRMCRLNSMVASSLGGVWGVEPGLADRDVSVVRGTDIGLDGTVDFGRAPRRGVTTSELAKRRLQSGDVVLEKSGGSPDQPVGKCAVVGEPPGLAVASNFVIVLRARDEVASGAYLAAVLQGMRVTGRMAQFVGKTTGISNLRTKELLSAEVPCPGLGEQGDFLRRLDQVKATRIRVAEEAARLARLKENLLSEAFR